MPDYDNSEAERRSKLVEAKAAEVNAALKARMAEPLTAPAPAPKKPAAKKSDG